MDAGFAAPSREEREALLELLRSLGGRLPCAGPIPYDALRASKHAAEAATPEVPAQPAAAADEVARAA